MSDSITSIIIGAGASCPYGLLSGQGLLEAIQGSRHGLLEVAKNTGSPAFIGNAPADVFDSITRSTCQSIDSFLELRPEFENIGKLAIAYHLLPKEQDAIMSINYSTHWIPRVTEHLRGDRDGFRRRFKFIIFNYDRILEFFIFNTLVHSLKMSRSEAAEYVGSLDIIHPYGTFKECPDFGCLQNIVNEDTDGSLYANAILQASKGIMVMQRGSQDGPVSSAFSTAQNWIAESDRVFFIGFGFDPLNCNRLGIRGKAWLQKRVRSFVGATTYGLRHNELARIAQMIGFSNHIKEGEYRHARYIPSVLASESCPLSLGNCKDDCLVFLRDYPI